MNLFERISLVVRAVASQTARSVSYAGQPPTASEDRTAHLLELAEKRLKRLNALLAEAVAREQRADRDWQAAAARAGALDAEVDAAVSGQQDETARARLEQLRRAQAKAIAAERTYRDYAAATEKLRIEIQDAQAQLDAARREYQQRAGNAGNVPPPQSDTAMQAAQREESRQRQAPAEAESDIEDSLDQTRIADLLSRRAKKED
uniref:hypothetical protein n=1 Tax=Candidatus Roseilinea sp. TaxID=2838777 RepID=UPI00404A00CC